MTTGAIAFASSGCVTVQEGSACSVAGKLSAGEQCSHLLASDTFRLSFTETVDFLEAQAERTCVPKGHWDLTDPSLWVADLPVCADDQTVGIPTVIPARGGAIAMSTTDWGAMKTELEEACRLLGKRCSYQLQRVIKMLQVNPLK